MALWLVCLSSDRTVQVQALAGHIVLHSWTRHLTLTVLNPSVQMGNCKFTAGGSTAMD